MPTGVLINTLSILLGGIAGALFGQKMDTKFKTEINLIFGICSMGMGINAIPLMKNMPAVIFAIIIGTALGLVLHLGDWIEKGARSMQKPIANICKNNRTMKEAEFINQLVTIIVLFCASGTGIYGSLTAGMTGDHSILVSKSILDFFTAAIFASSLGYVVSLIAIPQFLIFFLLFLCAGMILPMTSPAMIDDFKACGGFLMLATGFRMMKIKNFPTADMIPAMILVMPISFLWITYIM